MRIGFRIIFLEDGKGSYNSWGFDENHFSEWDSLMSGDFIWKNVSDSSIEIELKSERIILEYDIQSRIDSYGNTEICLINSEGQPDEYGEIGFWASPYSLVYSKCQSEAIKKKNWFGKIVGLFCKAKK